MTFPKSRAVFALMSFAAALALFLPIPGAAQTQSFTDASASAPKPKILRFSDGSEDFAFRITTDAAGNFYLATALTGSVHSDSFAIIKYSADGKRLGLPFPGRRRHCGRRQG
jgi:hypothetical protein